MDCQQCGIEIEDLARFCSSCGAEQRRSRADTSGEPVLTLRPVFVPFLQIAGNAPLFLFLAFWGCGFFGGFSMVLLQFLDTAIPTWLPFAFFGAAFAFGLPFLSYGVTKRTYARTVYTFHQDRLDYHEGFFTVEEKTIALERVTEVNLRKGPFQSRYGLGTILLSTPATSLGSGRASAGIRLRDVKDPDETYGRIKELVADAQAAQRRAA